MASTAAGATPVFPRIFAWARVRFTLAVSAAFGLLISFGNDVPTLLVIARAMLFGLGLLLVFGMLERWPRQLPGWLARFAWQLGGILLSVPICAIIAQILLGGAQRAGRGDHDGLGGLIAAGLLFAPWIAVGAILKQRDARAREQAHAFELERGEFERKVLDARLRLLQAQVEPHFLFNTLANVQALVDAGSPQAPKVLASLIAYLRAAVPRMGSQEATLEKELELVRAYLDLMQMRMAERLQYTLHVEPSAARVKCPPMTLLTLVENAIRHGIDPSESGGRIDVDIWLRNGRCLVRVTDTGVGLGAARSGAAGLGTGLATLRERLQLAFGGDVKLRLTETPPHGVCAELEFPARTEMP